MSTSVNEVSGALRLPHTGLIRVAGADAGSFLHAQLTNDFVGLGSSEVRLAAYCSPKGRMLASLIGFRHASDEIWLACRLEVLESTLKRLRMFVLRAKVTLAPCDDSVVLLGLAGRKTVSPFAGATELEPWRKLDLSGDAHVLRLPDGAGQTRWLWAGPQAAAEAVLAGQPELTVTHWDWLEVHSGVAPVLAATSETFVPQMLNYELVGGVNFQKGCYPGQEVVARSQYRGAVKRRAVLLHAPASAPAAGEALFWSGDTEQPSGLVALAAPAPSGGTDLLAEVKLVALEGGALHLGTPDGPVLERRPLPYALPQTDALR